MKTRLRNIMIVLFTICLLLECDFFIYVPVSILSDYNQKYILIALISISLTLVCFTNSTIKKSIKEQIKIIKIPIIITFVSVLIASLYSLCFTNMSFKEIVINAIPYFSVLLVFPLLYILKDNKSRKIVIYILTIVLFITLFYRSILTIRYIIKHTIPHETLLVPNGGLQVRYGIIKIYPTSIAALIILMLFALSFSLKIKLKKLERIAIFIVAIFGYAYFALFYQARLWTILLLAIMILLCLLNKTNWKNKLPIIFTLVIGFGFLVHSKIIFKFFASFTRSSQYWHSTEIRLRGVKFLISNLMSHPLGNGFLTEFYGNNVKYFADDYLGLQSFFRFGLLAVILYISYFVLFYKNLKKSRDNKYYLIQLALFLYITLCCLVIGVFVTRRLFVLAIAFSFSTYYATCKPSHNISKLKMRERV